MPDRDKISKGLQCIIDGTVRCESCGYAIDKHGHHSCQQECAKDALALLEEQETVEPKQVELYGKEDWYGLVCVCPDCKAVWMGSESETHFCPNCGRTVKWNDC